MELDQIPKRVFLDTSVLNFILEYGEYIFDGLIPPESLKHRVIEDINALHNIFLTGRGASWQIAISPMAFKEISDTKCSTKRYYLGKWLSEVWNYWLEILEDRRESFSYKERIYLKEYLLSNGTLDYIPDEKDKELISDSIIYRCDSFCTRDWKTILKYRDRLVSLPIKIMGPKEWWQLIYPFAGLLA